MERNADEDLIQSAASVMGEQKGRPPLFIILLVFLHKTAGSHH